MTTEAALGTVAVIPDPAPVPPLELVPDLPATPVTEIAVGITNALVAAWNAIRTRHPQVPEAVITMATGGRESAVKLAHFGKNRWTARKGETKHHEVFVTAESLRDGAEAVIATLIHEAAHGLNVARGIDDCSASQYHNKHFQAASEELGLMPKPGVSAYEKKKYGFAFTTMTDETKTAYADQITALDTAIQAERVPSWLLLGTGGGRTRKKTGTSAGAETETDGTDDAGQDGEVTPPRPEKEDRNYIKAVCACEPPTVIRVSPKTLERRKIMCGDCEKTFAQEA
ncbi:hypothetical protein GCM10010363_60660 [Streptomyces omiyaensis]|uniref:hypothetical protein n=1 Tax=Streptomyces omiyaensis TaxID=68247 RepID=UPI00167AFEF6|nr:hypothetical protein [Streptomyces omiyaensis]GGY71281.1 hypothetical protein GCM10010363_60660 [Streptomyces omiyaensis]